MRILRLPVYPFLIAMHPVVSLLASNLGQTRIGDALRALAAALLIAGLAMLVARLLTSSWNRGSLVAAILLLAFTSYGHVYGAARAISGPEFLLARHRGLIPSYALLVLAGILLTHRLSNWAGLNLSFNLLGLALLAFPVIQIAAFQIDLARAPRAQAVSGPSVEPGAAGQHPDVYLIILDAYTRADVLREEFGVNNQPFLTQLGDLGFEVFECSQSNYSQTELTLASSLNASYLEELPLDLSPGKRSRTELLFMIQDNRVRQLFQAAGYRVYAFETGYPWSEWKDADVYLQPGDRNTLRLNGFEVLLLQGTAMRAAVDARAALPAALGDWQSDPLRTHRERIDYALEVLPDLASDPGPKLVFAHLVIPHRPYLFAPPDGWAAEHGYLIPADGPSGLGAYEIGYRNQVLYLNYVLPDILRQVIQGTDEPPVVLLMGDHGADDAPPAQRSAILHALYLPGADLTDLTDALTPVNSLRLILNQALGLDLPLLEDRSLYSSYERPFDFRTTADICSP